MAGIDSEADKRMKTELATPPIERPTPDQLSSSNDGLYVRNSYLINPPILPMVHCPDITATPSINIHIIVRLYCLVLHCALSPCC